MQLSKNVIKSEFLLLQKRHSIRTLLHTEIHLVDKFGCVVVQAVDEIFVCQLIVSVDAFGGNLFFDFTVIVLAKNVTLWR